MTTMTELQQKQIEQAEELLFSGPQKAGFAKELFFGKFRDGIHFALSRAPGSRAKNRR